MKIIDISSSVYSKRPFNIIKVVKTSKESEEYEVLHILSKLGRDSICYEAFLFDLFGEEINSYIKIITESSYCQVYSWGINKWVNLLEANSSIWYKCKSEKRIVVN